MAPVGLGGREEKKADPETEALAYEVIGALIEVHKHLGPGLPEVAYKKAVSRELGLRGIAHELEALVPIVYKGELVGEGKVDILVKRRLVLELKVVEMLTDVHRAQAISYLQALHLQLALLVNFNVSVLKDGLKRIINTYRV
jgi:GxxExxY protein